MCFHILENPAENMIFRSAQYEMFSQELFILPIVAPEAQVALRKKLFTYFEINNLHINYIYYLHILRRKKTIYIFRKSEVCN